MTQHNPGPTSLLNPEIILPEEEFHAAHGKKKEWISESWTCGDEKPSQYCHDHLQAQLDWNSDPNELEREEDDVDKKDHETLYSELDDYLGDMPIWKNPIVLTPQCMTGWELHRLPLPSVLIRKQPVTCST